MDKRLSNLQRKQDGLLSRAQVLGLDGDDALIERQLASRRWARVHEGVYLDHTGKPTWRQRAWAAILTHAPCALAGVSALRAHGLDVGTPSDPIELVVDLRRRVDDPPGVTTRRIKEYASRVQSNLRPPRERIEHAALTMASRARTEDAAVAVISDVVRSGRTNVARIADALATRTRLRHRAFLEEVLADVDVGAMSALERRYLRDVERAHGLPVGVRQHREVIALAPDGEQITVVYRDVVYDDHLTIVELDGRLGHDKALDRWADLGRDLAAAVTGRITLRAGWQQALEPCRLAVVIATVLQQRGWTGSPRPCSPGCVVPE